MRRATKAQIHWLKNVASRPQVAAFLSRGKPQAARLLDLRTEKPSYRPALRGIYIGSKTFSSEGAAIRAAEREQKSLAKEADGISLDERAIGISSEAFELHDLADASRIQISTILHIGTMVAGRVQHGFPLKSELDEQFSEAFYSPANCQIWEHIEKSLEEDEDIYEWLSYLVDSDKLGFIICASLPHSVILNGESRGVYSESWFYGETYEDAVKAASEWGAQMALDIMKKHRARVAARTRSAARRKAGGKKARTAKKPTSNMPSGQAKKRRKA